MTDLAQHSATPPSTPAHRHLRCLGVAMAAGLVVGAVTAFAQGGVLPEVLAPLANSHGPWTLVAFALALTAPAARTGGLAGMLALACMLAGYVLTNDARGFPSSSAMMLYWGLAAVVAGPVLGVGAHWLRHRQGVRAAFGTAAMASVLIGEGLYGLTVVAATTPAAYWWGEIVAGAVGLAWVCALRLSRAVTIIEAVVCTAVVSALFPLATFYGADLMRMLP